MLSMAVTGAHILGGRYVLREVLGTGGMATVWRATDEVLGRDVAVKVLNEQYAADAGFLARFRREARNVAALRDSRIVTVFDTGFDGSTPYIVMELLVGRTLRQVLDEEGPLAPAEAIAVATAVCEALETAHAAGLVHRDIKPANIVLSGRDGRDVRDVKVLDFGIARAQFPAGGTRTQAVLGTAAYLSPEQAAGEQAGPQADLYGLGCVLFEMLTGSPPFTAETEVAVAYRQVHDKPPLPSSLRAGLTAKHDWVALQLLAKDPDGRPAGAAAARTALLSTLAPDQTSVLDAQPAAAAPRPARSYRPYGEGRFAWRPAEIVLAMALVAALAALAVVLLTPASGTAAGAQPPARPSHQVSSPPASGSPSASAPPAGQAPAGQAKAAGALLAALDGGVADGQVSQQAGQQLSQQLTQLLFNTPSQDPEQVEQQYSQLVEVFDQYKTQGQISGPAAIAIHQQLSALGAALGT
jgi:serine/threonine-protein kinase